jgi:hypothetical protein
MLALVISLIFQQTTTNCTTMGAATRCTSQPTITAPIDYGATQPSINVPIIARRDRSSGHAKKVGKLIAEGKCGEAEAYALKKGRIELAEQARRYCRVRP